MRQDSVAFVHPGLACPRCRSLALWVAAFCLAWAPPAQARIVINEVLASNVLTNVDDEGDNSDWVELLNLGTAEIDLQGMSLTDDPVG